MTDHDPLVPWGAAYYPAQGDGVTRSYAFVLVPGFTLLAFAAAVDPLRIANQLSQRPLYRWRVMSETGGAVASSSGIAVAVDGPLEPADRATSLLVCAGNPAEAAAAPAITAAVQRHHRFGGVAGGICTGAVALARAGLLAGRRFTLHWENQPGFVETFPDLTPTEGRFERDGRILTCGGGAAATDMMLAIIAADHGADFATMVSEMCLRTALPGGLPAQRSSPAALMATRNPLVLRVMAQMKARLDDPVPIADLARAQGCTRRSLERQFKAAVGRSPGAWCRDLRLDHGRSLLSSTNMSLTEIALACGFAAADPFSKSFKARFGFAPTRLKAGIGAAWSGPFAD